MLRRIINWYSVIYLGIGALLVVAIVCNMLFVNDLLITGIVLLILLGLTLILLIPTLKRIDRKAVAIVATTLIAVIAEIIFLLQYNYTAYIVANIAATVTAFTIMSKTYFQIKIMQYSSIRRRGGLIVIGLGLFVASFFILVAMSPRPFIRLMQATMDQGDYSIVSNYTGTPPNIDEVHEAHIDITYANSFPNSQLDLYLSNPSEGPTQENPTFFFVHGGGYVWGDKLEGDPTADTNGYLIYINDYLNAGYNFVSINYALAPEYQYPSPLIQMSQAINYLQANQEDLGIDMSNVVLGGVSAGGQIIGQFTNIQLNEDYAQELGIEPVMAREDMLAVVFSSTLFDNERFQETGYFINDYFFMQPGRAYFNAHFLKGHPQVIQSNVMNHATSNYPPTFISDGNHGTFYEQADDMYQRLNELGVPSVYNYYSRETEVLPHAFEFYDTPYAKENTQMQIDFINQFR